MEERTGNTIFMGIPYFPLMDMIRPEDIQDVLNVAAGQKVLNTLNAELDKRLMQIHMNHDMTWEWLCTQALQGKIIDGANTTLYDLYTTFGVAKTTVDFDLGTTTTDISGKCAQLWQSISQNLTQDTMSGVDCIVDPVFFQALISHANVKAYYQGAEQALALMNIQRMQGDRDSQMWGREIHLFNVTFREYYGQASIKVGGTRTNVPFWAAKTGTAYPRGAKTIFQTYDGPAHDIRYVNTRGQPIYISPKVLDHGQGIELLSQSNPLPIVRRPAAVVQITSST
jgi:hypothetical protein